MNLLKHKTSNKKRLRALVILLELLALGLFLYLVALPFVPAVKYKIHEKDVANIDWQDVNEVKNVVRAKLKRAGDSVEKPQEKSTELTPELTPELAPELALKQTQGMEDNEAKQASVPSYGMAKENRIIIPKIGVDSPIVDSDNYDYALNRGSWRDTKTSTPDKGGNTVITGHRFKYLPPNNLTFYSLDKVGIDDIFSVIWDGRDYYYKVIDKKIVPKSDTSILSQTSKSIVTIFTCEPIFSEKNRLVVVGELLEED